MKHQALRLVTVLLVTLGLSFLVSQWGINKENVLMIFMVGVLVVTVVTTKYRYGIIASLLSVLMFNFFFTEPLFSFTAYESNDVVLMIVFLLAATLSSSLTARLQQQSDLARQNEKNATFLYEINQRLLNVTGEDSIVKEALIFIRDSLNLNGEFFPPSSTKRTTDDPATSINFDVPGFAKSLGTLHISIPNNGLSPSTSRLIHAVANQLGVALDREFINREREAIRIEMEREHLKSNLLRSVSHDLRTPLTGIVGASSFLLERGKSLSLEDRQELIKDIKDQSVWLTTLVENMLNMARIDNGTLQVKKQLEVIDDVINEAVSLTVRLDERHFSVSQPDELLAIPMDGKAIVQVLLNLLNNAVTHTSKGSEIQLSIVPQTTSIDFIVDDAGTGIDPKIKHNLFEAFITSGKIGADGKRGIGLGLVICKTLVEAHGGTIRASSSPLGGARFEFTLPR